MTHNKAPIIPIHIVVKPDDLHPLVEPDVVTLDSFLEGLKDISLLSLYAHHVIRNMWEREVT